MHPYHKLRVLELARAAAVAVYRLTDSFPARERFGLTTQLRRAAISVGANIAEGSKRATQRDFAHFVNISEGSSGEVRFLLEVALELAVTTPEKAADVCAMFVRIERMLWKLRHRLVEK